ncbi:DUF748 domain-containing protein [Lysobacter niastensis]|uniref:DUF748 domain-containing protein n=1 Tax=Lysobacter niastensis TaxID=380629 RepID=A0ABS0B3H4_9GAMM|nr:DUF748 domain-containing protein [Lysobacter niastensis]MBF6023032.1 DUF748 domain-containing protein [Lysobacter niastensis]
MLRWIKPWMLLAVVLPLLAFGLYTAGGFWGVPRLIHWQAPKYVREELGKDLKLGEVRFNPFNFQLDIDGIAIDDPKDRQPMVALKQVHADFQVSSLWKRGYVFREVRLDGPFARAIIRPDGSLNLAELLPKDERDEPMPNVWIDELSVSHGRIDFADRSRALKPEKQLSPIEFTLKNFRTRDESGGFTLHAVSEDGERFDWQGKLSLEPIASNGRIAVSKLKARTAYEFLSEELPFQLSRGSIDFAGRYDFAVQPNAGTKLDVAMSKAVATDLGLRARGAGDDWVTVPSVALDNMRLSLARQSIDIDAVRIDGLKAKAWLDPDGSFNIDRLMAAPPQPLAVTRAGAAAKWKTNVGRIEVKQGDVEFEDRTVKPAATFKLAPLTLSAKAGSLDTTKPAPITAQTTINGKATASIEGEVVLDTMAADLHVEVAGMPLKDVQGYLPDYPKLTLRSGDAGAKGQLVLLPDDAPGPSISFSGSATVTDFEVIEVADQSELISWAKLDADGVRYTQAPDALSIERIHARKPNMRVFITPDRNFNLARAFATPAHTTLPASTSAQPEMPIKIGRLRLDDGVMDFADYSIDPNFRAKISALAGTISDFSTKADAVSTIDLRGQVINRFSPVVIRGKTSPLAYDRYTDIAMSFKNIELPLFNPYSGRWAGYAIAKGKLNTDLHYEINNRNLAAEHHVVIDQLEWGEATDSKDKVSLPIRMATSLLKDRHGVIDLQVPVAGTLDDPKFRVWPVIWQIIKNLLVKIVTAPFDWIGSLFKGAEKAQYVAFAPGSADLGEEARASLGNLAKGLVDRPAVKIEIPTATLAPADPEALAEKKIVQAMAPLGRRKEEGLTSLDELDPERRAELLAKLYKQEMGERPKLPETQEAPAAEEASRKERRAARDEGEAAWLRTELIDHYKVGEAELTALGQARANAIQEALLAGGELDPTRVFVTAAGKPPTEQEGQVRIELGLE